MKKVSIIIPCYNCAETLPRCLDSVLCQTYKNFEIIAVNDGSKDNTLNVLNEYNKKYPGIFKIINKTNAGVSAARNDAMKLASGDYIEFLDSDDNWLGNTMLEKNVLALEEKKVDAVIFNFIHPCFQTHLETGVYDLKNKSIFKKYYQDFFFNAMPWNKLFRKEVLTEPYDESMAFAEDELFNLANMKNIKKVFITTEVMYNYYCAPVVTKENASAINKIYVGDDFCTKKNTIWFKCVTNKIKRDVILQKNYKFLKNDMEFVRTFDFFFYDFAFMSHLNLNIETKKKHCAEGILKDENFIDVLLSKERYGLKLKSTDKADLKASMENFVELGSKAFSENRNKNLGMKIYLILFGIFAKCFYQKDGFILNTDDIMTEVWQNMEKNKTREAIYTNSLFSEISSKQRVFNPSEELSLEADADSLLASSFATTN